MPQSRSANAFAYLFRLAVLADGFVDFDDRRFTPYANILQIGGRQRKQTGFAGQHRCLAGRSSRPSTGSYGSGSAPGSTTISVMFGA